MRYVLALVLLALPALALQLGQLSFIDVNSAQELSAALKEGPVLIFIHQPDCPGCNYMKTQVFPRGDVAAVLKGVNLISIDLAKYLIRSLEVVADGQVYVYYDGSLRLQRASGAQNVPILGTPTVVMGYVKDGKLHVTLIMIGAAPPDQFIEFNKLAYSQPTGTATPTAPAATATASAAEAAPRSSDLTGAVMVAASFAAGALSVFSPCVLPVLTIAATTYLARRSLPLVLAGMVVSFAAVATLVSAAAAWAGPVANAVLYAVGGVVLIALGAVLIVERLNRAFVIWVSRFQTAAHKMSKTGAGAAADLALGASLGAVWTPCIAPFLGTVVVANLAAAALTGNYLAFFASTMAYAAGLAVVIYLIIALIRRGAAKAARSMKWSRWGRRAEYVVGALAIVLGVLLIGEALGLGTFSMIFKA
ncbi:cytochrome c biogenesis protein [Pyrobaculum arsenaticum]|uniref:Cytochrome c biogenesis protein, transmembrane region n=2 Tax=Pyrobaculum arsenaticum TaxID=121277 RepID=A4WIP7_PYRAR|nr:cytochrome c biogenesis protein [Pyrobaculum arsenaticum]ABP50264.1 cytochrome c biogenesis protein, transmembrane region [Pyrobaculum arsenaticum DSM 13514]NYR14798.1 cytochrome c biogenesis protein [Pyrobaculum arsenaticum]